MKLTLQIGNDKDVRKEVLSMVKEAIKTVSREELKAIILEVHGEKMEGFLTNAMKDYVSSWSYDYRFKDELTKLVRLILEKDHKKELTKMIKDEMTENARALVNKLSKGSIYNLK